MNEYEKELLHAAKSAVATVKEETAPPAPAPAPKKSSLLNFFRSSEPKQEDASSAPAPAEPPSSIGDDDLVGEMLPAKCFRAELYRTLTCAVCQYSRKQVEQFYDFSLDLPFHATTVLDSDAVREKPSKRQCYCDVDAAVRNTITERVYYCAKAACSYQDKVPTEIAPEPAPEPQQQHGEATEQAAGSGDSSGIPSAPHPPSRPTILLESLMRKQFESETLELSCEQCKTGKEAVAAYAVKSLPPVLVLHLKRFEVDFKSGKLYKRCDLVEAPASIRPKHAIVGDAFQGDEQSYELVVRQHLILCVSSLARHRDPNIIAAGALLQSVVHHLGRSIDEGHYVCDVRERAGEWVRRNDTHESLVGPTNDAFDALCGAFTATDTRYWNHPCCALACHVDQRRLRAACESESGVVLHALLRPIRHAKRESGPGERPRSRRE